jgi:hypothetical protein
LISSIVFPLEHFYTPSSRIASATIGAVCARFHLASGARLADSFCNTSIKIPEWIVYQTPLS